MNVPLATTRSRGHGLFRGRRHDVHVEELEPEAGDPLHKSVQRALVGQLSTERRGVGAYGDLAVVEFRPHRGTSLTHECHLVCS